MISYRNTTREAPLSALPSALAKALAAHAHASQLDLAGARAWITHRENPVADGLLGKLFGRRANPADPDAAHDVVLVLHRTHLLVASSGERRGTAVLSVALADASVARGSPLLACAGVAETRDGLSITGFHAHGASPASYFVGLGPEPAAHECACAVEAAIFAVKNAR